MADHALVCEGGLHLVGLEIFVEEFFRAVEEQAPEEVFRFRAAEERDELGDRDGRSEKHGLDEIVDLGPHRLVLRIRRGILLRELGDLSRGLLAVGPEEEMPSIREGAESLRIEGHLPQPELRELEVLDDRRAEQSRDIRGGADLESRGDLVRYASASETVRSFDDDDSWPRLGEVVRRDEAVVPRAYDDEVYRSHGPGAGKPSLRMSVSFRHRRVADQTFPDKLTLKATRSSKTRAQCRFLAT